MDDDCPQDAHVIALTMPLKTGSYQSHLSPAKDTLDFWLTRFPRLYLMVEEHREWQNWDKRVYLSVIERGDIVMDIGANVGAHTVAFSHLAGLEGSVLAYEPVPSNFERLRETVYRRTRYPNTAIFESAVGNPTAAGEQAMVRVPGDDFTQASLASHSDGSWKSASSLREFQVTLTSIDAEASRMGLAALDFVKVDVEGGELRVLEGGASTLSRFRPMIYCEVFARWTESFDYTPGRLFEYVASAGYSEARIIRDARVHRMNLGDAIPAGIFDASADVLFSAPAHSQRVARFDERYGA
jgi:FkbM family methyltransferase